MTYDKKMLNSINRLIPAIFCLAISDVFAVQLITTQEAALPSYDKQIITRGISRGPNIKINAPQSNSPVTAPFDLKVHFEPRGDSKIDPGSIKVTYLKSPTVDLTPRIKFGISASGIELQKADAPPGNHTLRVTVKDTDGRETNATLNLIISK